MSKDLVFFKIAFHYRYFFIRLMQSTYNSIKSPPPSSINASFLHSDFYRQGSARTGWKLSMSFSVLWFVASCLFQFCFWGTAPERVTTQAIIFCTSWSLSL